jgi:hypothetical protein
MSDLSYELRRIECECSRCAEVRENRKRQNLAGIHNRPQGYWERELIARKQDAHFEQLEREGVHTI